MGSVLSLWFRWRQQTTMVATVDLLFFFIFDSIKFTAISKLHLIFWYSSHNNKNGVCFVVRRRDKTESPNMNSVTYKAFGSPSVRSIQETRWMGGKNKNGKMMNKRSHRSRVRVYVFHHLCAAWMSVLRCLPSLAVCYAIGYDGSYIRYTYRTVSMNVCKTFYSLPYYWRNVSPAFILSLSLALSHSSSLCILSVFRTDTTHTQFLQCALTSSVQCIVILFSNFAVILWVFGCDKQTKQQQIEARQTCAPNTSLRLTHFHFISPSPSTVDTTVHIFQFTLFRITRNKLYRQLLVYDYTCDEEDVYIALLRIHEIQIRNVALKWYSLIDGCACQFANVFSHYTISHLPFILSFCHVNMMHTKTNTHSAESFLHLQSECGESDSKRVSCVRKCNTFFFSSHFLLDFHSRSRPAFNIPHTVVKNTRCRKCMKENIVGIRFNIEMMPLQFIWFECVTKATIAVCKKRKSVYVTSSYENLLDTEWETHKRTQMQKLRMCTCMKYASPVSLPHMRWLADLLTDGASGWECHRYVDLFAWNSVWCRVSSTSFAADIDWETMRFLSRIFFLQHGRRVLMVFVCRA